MNASTTANTSHPASRPGLAIMFRVASVITVSSMSAMVKLATQQGANTGEIMFYRYAFAMPFFLLWAARHGGLSVFATRRPVGQLTRGLIGVGSMTAMFLTLAHLPLPEATTFFFMAPLVATILSVFALREAVGIHRWVAIFVGGVGMLIMVQPGAHHGVSLAGAALGLTSALFLASSTITLRQLGSTESPVVTTFWFTAIGTAITAMLIPFYFQRHGPETWMLLLGAGLAGSVTQLFTTSALRYAPVSVTAPFDYAQLLFATLFGWLIWSELPGLATIIGAIFIGGAGLYTFYHERLRSHAPGISGSTPVE